MALRIGIDAGGTFTDVCVLTEDGAIITFKLPSTPTDPSEAIVEGATAGLALAGRRMSDVSYFGHGTTVATNTLLQLRGARTGIITTAGFRDLLDLARQQRPDLYDLQVDKPELLVRRLHRLEVSERMRFDGTCEAPLDDEQVRVAAGLLRSEGVEAVAVCLLYSYLYPAHEQRIGAILAEELPEAFVSLSHEVLAEFREYERLSSTVVNAYLGSTMSSYIARFGARVRELGGVVQPYITQSNGGLISLDAAGEFPVRTVLSGPAAGVIGAVEVGRSAGFSEIITFDMGGTSTDVALIEDLKPRMSQDLTVNGYPIRTPIIDINTVGAGGGSIAWVDSGGHLKVGPRSAGAAPGPAGYGQGGVNATVTDANLHLGALNRAQLLGGRMAVDAPAADAAITRLAEQLELPALDVANGVIAIVTANMARAIRVVSIERGYDPRSFALVAFGGAGPLHAARLARELEIPTIIVPPAPGILCAIGLLASDLRSDYSRTVSVKAEHAQLALAHGVFEELESMASDWFDHEVVEDDDRLVRRFADMRYVGQNYELTIELPSKDLDAATLRWLLDDFHTAHERAYGFAAPGEPAHIVTLRLEARGAVAKAEFAEIAAAEPGSAPMQAGLRDVYIVESGRWLDCPIYDRGGLLAGHEIEGPAIVEQMDATTLLLPGQWALVDRVGNLIIQEREGTPT